MAEFRLSLSTLAIAVAATFGGALTSAALAGGKGPQPRLPEETLLVGRDGVPIVVEVARTDEQREIGLMNRESMPPDRGMLFAWDDARVRAFWMKDTLIPLDMVFFTGDGHVVSVHRDAKPMSLDVIRSEGPASNVLEVDAGVAERLGIAPGQVIRLGSPKAR